MSAKPLLIGLVCAVLGVLGALRNWTTHTEETAIARDGVRAEGRVTRKRLADESEAGKDYMIGYSFDLPSGQRKRNTRSTLLVIERYGKATRLPCYTRASLRTAAFPRVPAPRRAAQPPSPRRSAR